MSGADATSFEARIVLRPRTLDETFDLALAYVRVHHRDLRRCFVAALVAALAPAAAAWLLLPDAPGIAGVLLILGVGVAERAVTVFAGRHLFGNPISVWAAWRQVLRRLPFNLAVVAGVYLPVLVMAAVAFEDDAWVGGGVVLGVFWPFLLASHAHVSEVAHLEHLSAGRATQRARSLVAYRFGRALGLLITGAAVRAGAAAVTVSLGTFVVGWVLQFGALAELGRIPLAVLGLGLSGPFMAMVRFFDYIDARTRREGWDIQVRFNAVAQRARQAQAGGLAA